MITIFSEISTLFLLTFMSQQNVYGYSSGAPKSACTSMTPNHQVEPQQGPSYHKFTILNEGPYFYSPGEKVNISLFVPDDSFSEFKGFMIQVSLDKYLLL